MIRPARFADAAALTRLLDELGYPRDVSDTRANLASWAGDPRSLLLLAEIHGVPAGFIAAHAIPTLESPGGFVRVVALAIDSAHRREGVGRQLLAAVEAWAAGLGCGGIELTSRRTRDDAHAFYRALGFEDACGRSALLRRSIA